MIQQIKSLIVWEIKILKMKLLLFRILPIYRKNPLGFYQGKIELLKLRSRLILSFNGSREKAELTEIRGSKYSRDLKRCQRILKLIWQGIYHQRECNWALKVYFENKRIKEEWNGKQNQDLKRA